MPDDKEIFFLLPSHEDTFGQKTIGEMALHKLGPYFFPDSETPFLEKYGNFFPSITCQKS